MTNEKVKEKCVRRGKSLLHGLQQDEYSKDRAKKDISIGFGDEKIFQRLYKSDNIDHSHGGHYSSVCITLQEGQI